MKLLKFDASQFHLFFDHSFAEGHISLLQILAIVIISAMNTDVHTHLWLPDTDSPWHTSWHGIAKSFGHLSVQKLPHWFPQRLYQFPFAAAVYSVLLPPYSNHHLLSFCFLDDSYSDLSLKKFQHSYHLLFVNGGAYWRGFCFFYIVW